MSSRPAPSTRAASVFGERGSGHRGPGQGSARAALAQPAFRRLWIAGFLSNIGSWMQTVTLGPFAYKLSGDSARFAGLVVLAQLGPQLFVAIPGGALSNAVPNRKRWMQFLQIVQLFAAVFMWWVARQAAPNKALVLLGVGIGGMFASLYGPSYQAIMPDLAGKANVAGAVSLGSIMVNGSRVLGPVVLWLIQRTIGLSTAGVFMLNAATFLFVIGVLFITPIRNAPPPDEETASGVGLLTEGFRVVRSRPLLARCLLIMFAMSLFSLPFIGQFPTVAERAFGVNSKSATYSLIYAVWGFGSLLSALSMGTVFAKVDKARIVRPMLLGFAAFLVAFSLARTPTTAMIFGFGLGLCYFGVPTALQTLMQQTLNRRERAPVLALWFMAFGGSVPIGSMWAGWVMDRVAGPRGIVVVLGIGAAVAGLLALAATHLHDPSASRSDGDDVRLRDAQPTPAPPPGR